MTEGPKPELTLEQRHLAERQMREAVREAREELVEARKTLIEYEIDPEKLTRSTHAQQSKQGFKRRPKRKSR